MMDEAAMLRKKAEELEGKAEAKLDGLHSGMKQGAETAKSSN